MSIFLKIKLKSLAAEARIIRRQELKTRGARHNDTREALHLHRIHVVRAAARHTHLAYGFIRGKSYEQLERSCDHPPSWKDVAAMIKKYGILKEKEFEQWQQRK